MSVPRPIRFLGAAALSATAAGALLLPFAAPAGAAADERGLDAAKKAAHTAITERTTALDRAIAVVRRSPFMGDDGQARIDAMQASSTGLQSLDDEIQADGTLAEVREDAAGITRDFRVYVLVLPVTHLTRGADAVTVESVPKLERLATKLQQAIDEKDADDLRPVLADLNAKVAAADAAASPIPDQIAPITPAGWNADHDVLAPSRQALREARADLKAARDDARTIIDGLKS